MPTGYTAEVADGKVTDFRVFALRCARAFGALVTMRDDPGDAPIPEAFTPSSYYAAALAEKRARLAELEAMSPVAIIDAARAANAEALASWEERRREREETAGRYRAMLAKVQAWEPPSDDHRGLKDFMRKQLDESLRFDCGYDHSRKPEIEEPQAWHARVLNDTRRELARLAVEEAKEIERTATRNRWLTELRASLD